MWHLDCVKAKKASPPRKTQNDASPIRKRPSSENCNVKMSTFDSLVRMYYNVMHYIVCRLG